MSARVRAEQSQPNEPWKAQAGPRQPRPSWSCLGAAAGHTEEPARVPPEERPWRALTLPEEAPIHIWDAEGVHADQCWGGCAGPFLQLHGSSLKQPTRRRADGCGQKRGDGRKVEGQTDSCQESGARRDGLQRGGKANTHIEGLANAALNAPSATNQRTQY